MNNNSLDDKYNNMTLKEAFEAYQKEEKEKQFHEANNMETENQKIKVQQNQETRSQKIKAEENNWQKEVEEEGLSNSDKQDSNKYMNPRKIIDIKMYDMEIPNMKIPDIEVPDMKISDIKIPDIRIADINTSDEKAYNANFDNQSISKEREYNLDSSNVSIPDRRENNPNSANKKMLDKKVHNKNPENTKMSDKRVNNTNSDNINRRKKMSGFEKFAEVGKWFQTICWIKIPIIGFLYILILAIRKKTPQDKKYFALGYLLYKILVWALAVVLIYWLYKFGLNFIDDMLSFVKV